MPVLSKSALAGVQIESLHLIAGNVNGRHGRHVFEQRPNRLRFGDDAPELFEHFQTVAGESSFRPVGNRKILTGRTGNDAVESVRNRRKIFNIESEFKFTGANDRKVFKLKPAPE